MPTNRREFIQTSAMLGTAAAFAGSILGNSPEVHAQDKPAGAVSAYKLMPLPYPYDALEPYIDARTVELHHDKHHNAYVAGLNKAEEELAKARAKGDFSMVDYWEKKAAFHGAGNFLHNVYWNCMAPKAGGQPKGELMKKIAEDFGSFDMFKNQFSGVGKAVEGSGWALLAYTSDRKLKIYQVEKHENLTSWNAMPILACDVWEHAYYLKYQNMRADYIAAWWNVVNWDWVEKRYIELSQK